MALHLPILGTFINWGLFIYLLATTTIIIFNIIIVLLVVVFYKYIVSEKYHLLLIGKSSLCSGCSGFPLLLFYHMSDAI